jgi:hypothetical protein
MNTDTATCARCSVLAPIGYDSTPTPATTMVASPAFPEFTYGSCAAHLGEALAAGLIEVTA